MTKTTTTYQVESHDYDCTATDPANCNKRGHWGWEREARSLAEAREWCKGDDAPATRITKIQRVVTITTEAVEARNSPLPLR